MSSLSFPLVASAIAGTALHILNVDMNDIQGDKKIVEILKIWRKKNSFENVTFQ